ncbi:MAG: peptidoglycan biosynthesis protein MviN, partial [Mycobacteriaceae bacterium]
AFPGVPAGVDRHADVQGLGAILYALITATWPLPAPAGTEITGSGTVGGMPAAVRREDGSPAPAREVRSGVPYEMSAVIARALQPDGGIRTAATVQTVLEQASVLDQPTDLMPAIDHRSMPDLNAGPGSPLDYDAPAPHPDVHPAVGGQGRGAHSRKMVFTLLGLALAAVVVIAYLANQLVGSLGANNAPLPSLSTAGTSAPGTAPAPAPQPAPGAPVVPVQASVYSPQGTRDQSATASRAIDGNPATSWDTDEYTQQLPRLKNGLGLMLTLPDSTALSTVTVDSPSAGTVVEIRSSPSANPDLSDTTVLGTATLTDARTTITLDKPKPTRYVLVWITKLGGTSTPYSSKLAELTLQRAG